MSASKELDEKSGAEGGSLPAVLPALDRHTNGHEDVGAKAAAAAAALEPDEFVPVGITRIEAFYSVFGKSWKLWGFWVTFMIWICAHSLSLDTTSVCESALKATVGKRTRARTY